MSGRELLFNWSWWQNVTTQNEELTSQLEPAADVSVKQVASSLFFNVIVFFILLASYEVLRRLLPSVYSARKISQLRTGSSSSYGISQGSLTRDQSVASIPTGTYVPMDWIGPVLGVSWDRVREQAGLDGYFFLRYLRMCLRITAVSSFWAFVILVPVFATGANNATGWYRVSMINIPSNSWKIWFPSVFLYLFSIFCFFVMKQEYKHFLELRQDFLGKGDESRRVSPQHHYSLMIENIPVELRSDTALFDYFNSLFPGKVHSAMVMLKLPDLEALSLRRLRVVSRLEKSIACQIATGERQTHVMGRPRTKCCSIDMGPCSFRCFECNDGNVYYVDESSPDPPRGAKVDSISYYTHDLAVCNKNVAALQNAKVMVAATGNTSIRADNWLEYAVNVANDAFEDAADQILEDSIEENALRSPRDSFDMDSTEIRKAERMTISSGKYGSFIATPESLGINRMNLEDGVNGGGEVGKGTSPPRSDSRRDKKVPLIEDDHLGLVGMGLRASPSTATQPGHSDKNKGLLRRIGVRLGLDFFIALVKYLSRRLEAVVVNVVGATMSSTGFVTFLDLASVTCAGGARLTVKPGLLNVRVAPEPRDIRWCSVHEDSKLLNARETFANVLLTLGVILWSVPVAAIQTFANAEQVARIPGMEWVLTFDGGSIRAFINGYLPVLALLGLILILPVIFEAIAVSYEKRKTLSDVQRSILTRYFYYQLANIYVTVTAGSLWNSLADIIDRPSNILQILGKSLPSVVGYFVSLLLTKILAGLPMVILRMGALGRMLFLRSFFTSDTLTQRELDKIYRPDPVQYGWEYPSQLLVIMICQVYACICPVILPFGAIYFLVAMMVYKKQILYVYTPIYESGATFFPLACDRTLFGLVCGQLTFIGYSIIRETKYQPAFLLPLPFFTIWVMGYFREHYAYPSNRLSVERAMECDRVSDIRASRSGTFGEVNGCGAIMRGRRFNKSAYRQPVLTDGPMEPLPYRRDTDDPLTDETIQRLHQWSQSFANNSYSRSANDDENSTLT